MKCIICKGTGTLGSAERQLETCYNCNGSGEIVTEEMVNGNDCPNGQYS